MLFFKQVSHWIATGAYTGYLPKMPGTWGSLWACFFYLLLPVNWYVFTTLLIALVGTITTREFLTSTTEKDPSCVVIDEVLGIGIVFYVIVAVLNLPPVYLGLGVVFFRFFDAVKVGVVKWIDSKDSSSLFVKALYIMLDDVAAAIQAVIVVFVVSCFLA